MPRFGRAVEPAAQEPAVVVVDFSTVGFDGEGLPETFLRLVVNFQVLIDFGTDQPGKLVFRVRFLGVFNTCRRLTVILTAHIFHCQLGFDIGNLIGFFYPRGR